MERSTAVRPYQRVGRQRIPFPSHVKRLRYRPFFGAISVFAGLHRDAIGVLLAQTVLTRLHLLGELAPFGLAFWAVAGKGESGRMAVFGVAAALAALSTGDSVYVLSLVLSMLVFSLLLERVTALPLSALAGLSQLVGAIPGIWVNYFHTYDLLLLGLETMLVVLAVIVFERVFRQPLSSLNVNRHVDDLAAWVVFLGLLLLSLIQGGEVLAWLAGWAARVFVLWGSFLFGPGMAAAAGALLGFLLGVHGNAIFWLGVLSFAGFLSGLFRPYGRFAVACGFLLATVSLSLYLGGWEAVTAEAALTGGAAVFFLLAPVLPLRLRRVLDFFGPRSDADEGLRVRELTAVRIKDYALVFHELSAAFQQATAVEAEKGAVPAPLVEELVGRVCKFCPSRLRCWEQNAQRTYNAILRLLHELDSGQAVSEVKTPDFFQRHCRKKESFLQSLAFLKEKETLNGGWQKRLEDGRGLVSLQLSGLSQSLMELAGEVREGSQGVYRQRSACFHVEIGVAQAAKSCQDVSGDYYSYLELRDGRQAFILSDGMGCGSKACQESRATVQLVEQLLLAGFRREPIVRTVNTILQLRSREESFATLDVLLVDPVKGEAEFLKVGAAPSFLCARDTVREIRTPSVPLGILSDVEVKHVSVELGDDTLLVMVTDGIFEVRPFKPDWVNKYLEGKLPRHPQVLADELIHYARTASGQQELRDDISVLVCRVKRLRPKIRDFATG